MEGVEPTYLRYKGNVITIIRHQRYVEHLEGFEPPFLGLQSSAYIHSTTGAYVVGLVGYDPTLFTVSA